MYVSVLLWTSDYNKNNWVRKYNIVCHYMVHSSGVTVFHLCVFNASTHWNLEAEHIWHGFRCVCGCDYVDEMIFCILRGKWDVIIYVICTENGSYAIFFDVYSTINVLNTRRLHFHNNQYFQRNIITVNQSNQLYFFFPKLFSHAFEK